NPAFSPGSNPRKEAASAFAPFFQGGLTPGLAVRLTLIYCNFHIATVKITLRGNSLDGPPRTFASQLPSIPAPFKVRLVNCPAPPFRVRLDTARSAAIVYQRRLSGNSILYFSSRCRNSLHRTGRGILYQTTVNIKAAAFLPVHLAISHEMFTKCWVS